MDIEQSAKNRLLTKANNVFNLRNMVDSLTSGKWLFHWSDTRQSENFCDGIRKV